ncbi:MAG: hypothetical protein R3F17_05395 [Planctomycetota bacterium]
MKRAVFPILVVLLLPLGLWKLTHDRTDSAADERPEPGPQPDGLLHAAVRPGDPAIPTQLR